MEIKLSCFVEKTEATRFEMGYMYDFILGYETYEEFVDHIERFAGSVLTTGTNKLNKEAAERVDVLLNGANARAVTAFLESSFRKSNGVFFTCESLSAKVADKIKPELQAGASVLDPACGSGDLLLACSKYMPRKKSLTETINYWSSRFHGVDLYPDFVRSAKARLALAAAHGANSKKRSGLCSNTFSRLIAQDFLKSNEIVREVDCIVTNPPFGQIDLTGLVDWGTGKGQLAALFIDQIINNAIDGQRVVAILPDVLRSGERYRKWRKFIQKNAMNINVEIFGRFNSEADVDVFILDFCIDKKNDSPEFSEWFEISRQKRNPEATVSKAFNVSVGPVVPHRDLESGKKIPFVDARCAPIWKEFEPSEKRGYECTLKSPPFVVVRRTSSPEDKSRVKASIVRGCAPVAVENHLIVLEPKDGKLKTCRQFLQTAKTDQFSIILNEDIRCRHLTVRSIKNLPWQSTAITQRHI
jgi:hypothetical protein